MSGILLLTSAAPEKSAFYTTEKRPPLGVGSLISVLRENGHEVHFIDRYLGMTIDPFEYAIDYNIDYVGIYSDTICLRDTKFLIKAFSRLREWGEWHGKIMVGGPHVSIGIESLQDMGVDHLVIGEGEKVILDIVEGRTEDQVISGKRMTSEELDRLPFQPWDIFTDMPYDYDCEWMDATPTFTMNTSRGCPFNCAFCSVNSIWGIKYTRFGAERILDEIEFLCNEYNAKGIYFREDNFTLDKKRVDEFCKGIKERGIDISWACETRVDNLDEQRVKTMGDAGCSAFYLGVESGSSRILDIVNKKIDADQIRNVVRWGKEFGVRSYCSLITGIPSETFQDYKMSKKLIKQINPYKYAFNVFVGIPFSDLYLESYDNKGYEHIDDIGLLYLPGYDIKSEFFYGKKIHEITDLKFNRDLWSDYDKELYKRIHLKRLLRFGGRILSRMGLM